MKRGLGAAVVAGTPGVVLGPDQPPELRAEPR